ncbi:MAG: DNA sulfur modification protein DndB [Nannocystaceae bacterium]
MSAEHHYVFTALRGVQAGREYYVTMCLLRLLPKLFIFDEEELAPELRAQRTLNRARIPDLVRYVVGNPHDYVFSSITASIDRMVHFQPFDDGTRHPRVGRLFVPLASRFIINDGQHRRAAIEEALRERPELGDETISVVLFIDAGLKSTQQMFADLNRHAIRPTRSIGVLYDHRDPVSQLARRLVDVVPVFQGLTELEKTSISNRSRKLFTLSSVYLATQRLLRKSKSSSVSEQEAQLAIDFWTEIGRNISDWQAAVKRTVTPSELRRDYIHAHAVALQALAHVGSDIIASNPERWKQSLRGLKKLDWSRSNIQLWEGRALLNGRISKTQSSVQLTANVIKTTLGISLTSHDRQIEDEHAKNSRT